MLEAFLLRLFFYFSLAFSVGSTTLAEEAVFGSALPDMSEITDVNEKKQVFFDFLSPLVEQVNERIQGERAWLFAVQQQLQQNTSLENWQVEYLSELARYYRIEFDEPSAEFFKAMFDRVDTIPASLVLAQAANESAWGTSRFAVEGNNLFGQWCFTEGCGLVPAGREAGQRHEVRVFDSVLESVNGYFRNINTHVQYTELRNIRSEFRFLREPLDSEYLAWGLEGYSIRGYHYIKELVDMIRFNNLSSFDQPAFYASLPIGLQQVR